MEWGDRHGEWFHPVQFANLRTFELAPGDYTLALSRTHRMHPVRSGVESKMDELFGVVHADWAEDEWIEDEWVEDEP